MAKIHEVNSVTKKYPYSYTIPLCNDILALTSFFQKNKSGKLEVSSKLKICFNLYTQRATIQAKGLTYLRKTSMRTLDTPLRDH